MNDVLQNAPVMGMRRKYPCNFGRYVLEKSLSRGGMGEVMLAIAKGVNQRCVIKTIRGDLTGDEEFIGRFADEAKIMVRIVNENIIRVFDAGKVDSDYYIAMEYVHGRDLGDVLDRAYERGEPMPLQLGLYVTSKVLDGLEYAHNLTDEHGRHMGLVHRDISPQNVLIGFDGSVKLIDFGLARTDLLPSRTQGALAVGKYGYMSPEQARHEKLDGRADLYSTGVMLFEVFTGDRLVDEQDQATLWARVLNPKHRPPRSVLPSLPPEIDDLIMRAVAVEPRDRFGSALDMQRFADRLRTPESSKDTLIKYLRYLYPKLDFSAPPIPELNALGLHGTDRSLIIATSREGQRSVFGRGALPIEGTTTINAEELRRAFKSRQSREVATDPHITEKPPQLVERPRPQRIAVQDPAEEILNTPGAPLMTIDGPTQIAHIPGLPGSMSSDMDFDEETRAASPMVRALPEEDSMEEEPSDHTLEAAPVRGLRPDSLSYAGDEVTIMMDAPPRHLTEDSDPIIPVGNDATKLSRLPKPDVLKITPATGSPSPVSASSASSASSNRGREIKERVSAQQERNERNERMERAVRTAERGIEIHRQTVPIEISSRPAPQRRGPADRGFSAPEMTEPEATPPRGSSLLLPGLILFGLAVMIVILVLILIRMG